MVKSGNSKGFIADYAIIGFGISGAMIASELLLRGRSFVVFDAMDQKSASRVAAGVINPVVYRRFAPVPRAAQYLKKAYLTYRHLEKKLGQDLLHSISFLKLFDGLDERHKWQLNAFEPGNEEYMNSHVFEDNFKDSIRNDFGAGEILKAGWLDIPLLLDSFADYLKSRGQYIDVQIEEDMIDYQNEAIQICNSSMNVRVKIMVWSNGIKVNSGSIFGWLPFKNSKGETLEIQSDTLSTNYLFHKGVFVLPRKGLHYVGATYNWKDDTLETTEEGKGELINKLNRFVLKSYQIVSHKAGLRPATKDRKPFVGAHPELNHTYIFNGMGSRGVLWAPLLAEELINFIESGTSLHDGIDIKRYFKHYTK
jgi:glycine oxidase